MKNKLSLFFVCMMWALGYQSYAQCNYGKGNTLFRDLNNLCAPSEVNWRITYIGLDPSQTNEAVIDWGDGSPTEVATLVDVTGTGSPSMREWQVTVPHIYPRMLDQCTYEAVVNLRVSGVVCDVSEGGMQQKQSIIVWDTDDWRGNGLITNKEEYKICAGNSATVNFIDITQFACLSKEDPNNLGRWIQWEYGTGGSNITGDVKIGGTVRANGYNDNIVWFDRTALASNVTTKNITIPSTAQAGEYYELTLKNWNTCNPYEKGGAPTGVLPVTKTVYIRIIDSPKTNFSMSPSPACAGNTVNFTNSSQAGLQYLWDFGDGNTSTSTSPSHVFTTPGIYDVMLTVTDDQIIGNTGTCNNTITKQITILPQPQADFSFTPSGAQCENTTIAVTNESLNVPAGTTWKWEVKKTDGQLVTTTGSNTGGVASTSQDITLTLPYYGSSAVAEYLVRLTANTPNQCENISAWKTLEVKANVGSPVFSSPLTVRCQGGGTTQYNATALYADSYTWQLLPVSAGVVDSNGLVTWNTAFSGSATLQVTAKGCGSDRSATQAITVTPTVGTPTAIGGDTDICQGTTSSVFTTSATDATSFTWSVSGAGNTISGNTSSATVTWGSGFIGNAVVSVVANGCNGPSVAVTKTVNIKPAPQLTNPVADYSASICSGQGISFTPTVDVVGSSFSWTTTIEGTSIGGYTVSGSKLADGVNNIADVLTNTGTTAGKVTYHITPFKDGCYGETKDFVVIVTPGKPDSAGPISGNTAICEGAGSESYSVAAIKNAVVYNWTLPAGASITSGVNTNTVTIDYSGTVPGTYDLKVYGENDCGTGAESVLSITVKPVPVLSATAVQSSICSTEEIEINLSADQPGTVYSWVVINKGAGISNESNGTNENVSQIKQALTNSLFVSQDITYRITPVLNGCEGLSQDVTITVLPTPDLIITGAPASVCSNGDIDISLNSNVAGTTFNWTVSTSDPGVSGAIDGSGDRIQHTLVNNTLIEQEVTYNIFSEANGCSGESKTIVIKVKPVPVLSVTVADDELCVGETTNIALSANVAGTSFSWTAVASDAGVGGYGNGSGSTIAQTLTNNTIIQQTVTYTIAPEADGCAGESKQVVIKINPKSTLSITGPEQLCSNEATDLALASNINATTFTWVATFDPTKVSGASNGSTSGTGSKIIQTLTNLTSQTQTVTYQVTTEANGCAGESLTKTIQVYPTPDVTLSASKTEICSNEQVNIGFSGSVLGTSYSWTVDISNPSILMGATDGTGSNISQFLTNTGTTPVDVTYWVTPQANGCSGSVQSVIITVNPDVSVSQAGPDDQVCGLEYVLDATEPIVGTGKWTLNSTGSVVFADDTDPKTVVTVQSGFGNYTFRWTLTNGTCNTSVDYVTVNFIDAPTTSNITGSSAVCVNTSSALYKIDNHVGSIYNWSLEPALNAPTIDYGGGVNDYLISLNFGANEWEGDLIVSETNNGCVGTPKKLHIRSYQLPVAHAGDDQTICQGTSVTLGGAPSATGGSGSYSYLWTPTTGLDDATKANPLANIAVSRTYILKITDQNTGCVSSTDTINITVEPTLNAGTIGDDQVICEGSIPSPFTQSVASGGNGVFSYQWQSSDTRGGVYTNIAGATNPSYEVTTSMSSTRYFRRLVSSGVCGQVSTDTIEVIVQSALTAGTIGSDQTIVAGATPALLTNESNATGGNGSYAYQWQKATGSGTSFSNIAGATGATYQPLALSATTFYRRVVTAGVCNPQISNVIVVSVEAASEAGKIGDDQIICYNSVPTMIIQKDPASGGTGSYQYRWMFSEDGVGYTEIAGENGINYTPTTGLTQTTYFKREVKSGVAGTWVSSNAVVVTVESFIDAGEVQGEQTICEGGNPTAFTILNAPQGGSGTYVYQWKHANSASGPFNDIIGATQSTYDVPAGLTSTTYYVREVSAGVCPPMLSNVLEVIVEPTLLPGTISTDETVCYGDDPVPFTATTPQGGNGIFAYQWQKKIAGSPYQNISGANDATYDPPTGIEYTTTFRRQVTSGACATGYSNEIVVTVQPSLYSGSIALSGSSIVCENSDPSQINSISPASGGAGIGTYQYQWKYSYDINGTFTDIPGAINASYNPPAGISATTHYIREVISESCGPVLSNIVTIEVEPTLLAGSVAGDVTLCRGSVPGIFSNVTSASGGDGNYSYQWQQASQPGGPYANITGANGETYQVSSPVNTTTFYVRMVTGGVCAPQLSNEIKVTIEDPVVPGTISSSQVICAGDVPEGFTQTIASGGDGNYSYQWQTAVSSAGPFYDIVGANTATYSIIDPVYNTIYYRRKVGAGVCDSVYSNVVEILVQPIVTAGNVGDDQIIPYGTVPQELKEITSPAGGTGVYAYQWKYAESRNGPYANIPGAINKNYTPGSLMVDSYFVREVSSGQCPPVYTDTISVLVEPTSEAGIIGYNQTICENSVPETLVETSAASGGVGGYSYQWQSSSESNTGYTDMVGEINNTLTFSTGLTATTYYRRGAKSGVSPMVYTIPVKITVEPTLSGGTISGNQVICEGGDPALFEESVAPSGGSGQYDYQWKSSTDPDVNRVYADIPLATNKLYNVAAGLTETTYYVREVSSGVCGTVLSNVLVVEVEPMLMAGSVTGDQVLCYGDAVSKLENVDLPTGGSGQYDYQWKSSTSSNGTFVNISGANDPDYEISGVLGETTYFLREVYSGQCSPKVSNVIKVTIEPVLQSGQVVGSQRICSGSVPSPFVSAEAASGGNGQYVYQWQYKTLSGEYQNIPAAYGESYTVTVGLEETTMYRRRVSGGVCDTVYTDPIIVTVDPPLYPGKISGNQSIVIGGDPAGLQEVEAVAGGQLDQRFYQWQSTTSLEAGFASIPGALSFEYDPPVGLMDTTYYRRRVTSGVCGEAYSDTVTVIVELPLLAGNIGGDQVICEETIPDNLVETEPASGGNGIYDYQWKSSSNPLGPFQDITDGSVEDPKAKELVFVQGMVDTTYFVREVSSGAYLPVTTNKVVAVFVQPALQAGQIGADGPTEICFSDQPGLLINEESPQGGNSSYSYQWYVATEPGGSYEAIIGATFPEYQPGNDLEVTSYFVRGVSSGECQELYSNEIEVIVNPLPEVKLVSSVAGNKICAGTEVTFTASGADMYTFYVNGIEVQALSSNNVYITDTLVHSDEVHALGLDTKGCQSLSPSITTTVYDIPTATIDGPTEICEGDQANITLRMTGKMPFEVRYTDGTEVFTLSNLSFETLINMQPSVTTTYKLLSVSDGNGCGQTLEDQELLVTVEHAVAKFSVEGEAEGCSPLAISFVNEDIREGVTYTWVWGDGTEDDITTIADSSVIEHVFNNYSNTSDRRYQVTLIAQNDTLGCSDSQVIPVTIYPTIDVRIEQDIDKGCAPLQVSFTNNSLGVQQHRWFYRVKGSSQQQEVTLSKSSSFILENKTPETITYEVVYEGVAAHCSTGPLVYEVEVYPELNPMFSASPEQQHLPNSMVFIDNRTNEGDWEYLWDFGDGTTSNSSSPESHTYETYGEFLITLNVSNEGCEEQYQQRVIIDIDPDLPFVEFETDQFEGCGPLTVEFINKSNYIDPSTIQWDFGDGTGISTAIDPVHTYMEPGKYSVSLKAINIFNEQKMIVKEFLVHVYDQPKSLFRAGPSTVYLPDRPVSTENQSLEATSYLWDFGDGTTYTEAEPTHFYTEEGVYDITLIAYNESGCSDTLTIPEAVTVEKPKVAKTRIPNSFTPDPSGSSGGYYQTGDVSNNIFIPVTDGVITFHMEIYNRWGKLLFISNDKNIGWDGYHEGKLCPADVYMYKIDFKYISGERITKYGDVTLIR